MFASDDFKVTPHLTLNLGLRWQMQSGWGVSNNLFGNYDPVIPDPTQYGGAYPGGILFGGQSDKAFGGNDRQPVGHPKRRLQGIRAPHRLRLVTSR